MKLKIKVTKEILQRSSMCGQSLNEADAPKHCAIALAVREVLGDVLVLNDRITTIRYDSSGFEIAGRRVATLSGAATNFINFFDQASSNLRESMDEFEFEIYVKRWFVNQVSLKDLENCPTMELVEP